MRRTRINFKTDEDAKNVLENLHSTARIYKDEQGTFVNFLPKKLEELEKTIKKVDGYYTAEPLPKRKKHNKEKGEWGGKRKGSGRKPKGEEARTTQSITVDSETKDILSRYVGTKSEFVCKAIKAYFGIIYGYRTYKDGYVDSEVLFRTKEERNEAADKVTFIDDIELFETKIEGGD